MIAVIASLFLAVVAPPVSATVESSLPTAGNDIRQLAFDGDGDSAFVSSRKLRADDHLTLVFEKPVNVKSVSVVTGQAKGTDKLQDGVLEASVDGSTFEPLAKFTDGTARGDGKGKAFKAVRVKAKADAEVPLTVREFTVDADPPVAVFMNPVEFAVNTDDAPDLKDWGEKVARVCEKAWPMINDELKSDGFKPRKLVTITMKKDYDGVAYASGGRIVGSVKYFKNKPDDVGAMVHEAAHVVQQYRTRNNPGWLVEGIADYVRFFKYEANKPKPLNPDRAKYDGSYRTTAAFLAFASEKYDKDLVRKLNQAMREGEYREELFKVYTTKTVKELETEWKDSLRK